MSVTIKSAHEIELMREAGRLLNIVHKELEAAIRPGFGCVPNFLNYNGFPASFCISINDEVVHGIPSKEKILHEGDIVSIDAGLIYKGMHSDAARTYGVGQISPEAQKLIDVTKESFFKGIELAKDGNHLHQISAAIGDYAESFGYGVVRDLVGHGIGHALHEDPQIPNFPQKTKGIRLQSGWTRTGR